MNFESTSRVYSGAPGPVGYDRANVAGVCACSFSGTYPSAETADAFAKTAQEDFELMLQVDMAFIDWLTRKGLNE